MATKKQEGKVIMENRMDKSDPKNIIFEKVVASKVKKFCADLGMMKVNGNKLMTIVIVKEQQPRKKGEACKGHRAVIQANNGTAVDFAESVITFLAELGLPLEVVGLGLAHAISNKMIAGLNADEGKKVAAKK